MSSVMRDTATTGITALDTVLGGLYWGDNVVWDASGADAAEPFFQAVVDHADEYDSAAYVTLTRTPEEVRALYPGLEIVDARPGTSVAQPRPLLDALRKRCSASGRDLLLLDTLEAMSAQWGPELAGRFFALGCPMLLGLGAIAYWSLDPGSHPAELRREIEGITQCVLVLGEGRLRIAKAEGRPAGVAGSVFRYRVDGGRPVLEEARAAARLGAALRSLRASRRLSQRDLAQLADVSPSAISQAERGRRGLSLDTLLHLSAKLNLTLDELLRGDVAPGYRLARRDDPRHAARDTPVPLLDDPTTGLRAYVLRLSPGASASPDFAHKGVELVAVATGLVQIMLETGRPVLRAGESLIAEQRGVLGWRNLTDREAMLFWILHDERPGGV